MGSGVIDSDHIIRDERDLLNRYVHHVLGEVTRIDTSNRELLVRYSEGMDEIAGTGGEVEAVYAYDYLVLATGARLVPADLNGLSETESLGQWHHFYSAEGALELRKALQPFEGRRIVITVGGIPFEPHFVHRLLTGLHALPPSRIDHSCNTLHTLPPMRPCRCR